MSGACDGEEWRPTVMGFYRLKLLLIEHNDLLYWKATDDNFSVLEHLGLRCCYYLDKIPIEFAEIHSLQLIELNWCLPGLGESAAQIQKEQEDIGNNPVDVCISNPSFANEALPSEFETIGKQIAQKCHGLPLTIVVVAGLLKSKRAREYWENVAKDVKSFFTNDPDKQCSRVLGLSYNHLTSDLKACLLHFGIFREDSEIPVKNLMRSWMAEGFLKLENDLEGEADKCLQELVDRCLVLICKKSLDGTKIRSCKVHDLIYELCMREIQRENIFIMNDIALGVAECGNLSMQKMQPFKRVTGDKIECRLYGLYRALLTPIHRQLRGHDNNDLLERTHSIFSFHLKYSYFIVKSELIHFKLLRVLELRNIDMDHFPVQILSLIWLRYLSLQCSRNLNIQTISYLYPRCCTNEVILGIQNVKEIGIFGNEIRSNGLLNSLVHLQQLETLSLIYCSS
ncbi:hypothetical protein CQW23_33917 [Capsicum baccatum]|uniref:Disease resistance protein winged helix domain-containing protein n=1 Tax=Capsicum baccatum TaxID=33114 RepID=A0A2G2V0C8_CAPBA|nr:hypothetical protein CQW23_33917 [Capsicum baccatum]